MHWNEALWNNQWKHFVLFTFDQKNWTEYKFRNALGHWTQCHRDILLFDCQVTQIGKRWPVTRFYLLFFFVISDVFLLFFAPFKSRTKIKIRNADFVLHLNLTQKKWLTFILTTRACHCAFCVIFLNWRFLRFQCMAV